MRDEAWFAQPLDERYTGWQADFSCDQFITALAWLHERDAEFARLVNQRMTLSFSTKELGPYEACGGEPLASVNTDTALTEAIFEALRSGIEARVSQLLGATSVRDGVSRKSLRLGLDLIFDHAWRAELEAWLEAMGSFAEADGELLYQWWRARYPLRIEPQRIGALVEQSARHLGFARYGKSLESGRPTQASPTRLDARRLRSRVWETPAFWLQVRSAAPLPIPFTPEIAPNKLFGSLVGQAVAKRVFSYFRLEPEPPYVANGSYELPHIVALFTLDWLRASLSVEPRAHAPAQRTLGERLRERVFDQPSPRRGGLMQLFDQLPAATRIEVDVVRDTLGKAPDAWALLRPTLDPKGEVSWPAAVPLQAMLAGYAKLAKRLAKKQAPSDG